MISLMWNLETKKDEHREKKKKERDRDRDRDRERDRERSKPLNRLLTIENKLRVAGGEMGRGMG